MSAPRMLSRRTALRWLLSSVGAVAAVACGPATPPTATTAPPPTTVSGATTAPATAASVASTPAPIVQPAAASTSAVAQSRSGGTLRVGLVGDLTTLDGHLLIRGAEESIGSVYEKLTAYDNNLHPQPLLAESWEFSSDAKRLKFNLRKGVQLAA